MSDYYDQRECRSQDERREVLTAEIIAQLKHAKANTSVYAERFKEFDLEQINSLEALQKLPVTRKSELIALQKQTPPFGGFTAIDQYSLDHIFISPGPIYEPQTSRPNYWRFARALHAAGFRSGDIIHNSFSYHMTPAGMMFNNGGHAIGATVIPGGVGQTEQQLDAINRLKPTGYAGTPSFLKILFEKAAELNVEISSIKKALVSGEAFPPVIRQGLKERGVEAVQCFATADLGMIAYESNADSGLIIDEDIFIEIVRPGTGETVPTGEVGEIVVTTLNPDYPLIRFATGDMSAFMEGESACGRTNLRIKGWMGRADQTAKVKGMFIHPEQIADIVKKHNAVSKARLVIEWINQADHMTLHCESTDQTEEFTNKIGQSIRDLCKVGGDVNIVDPGSLANDGIVIEDSRKYD